MRSVILSAASQILVGLLLVFSVFMLLRGHNEPGGGFIGGLIGATGLILHSIACGAEDARKALRVSPESLAMVGFGIAVVSGLASIIFNDAMLTGQWLFLFAEEGEKGIPLSTVLGFDIGVYLVVMGAILSLVFALEEEV